MDFSKNYAMKVQNEIQDMHWGLCIDKWLILAKK
jgi:hypothetical protein